MQVIFIVVAVTGLLYFLFAKRQFDFFTVAFFSACVYFMPGFFGFVLTPVISEIPLSHLVFLGENAYADQTTLANEAYWVMIAVLSAILSGAIWFDLGNRHREMKVTLRGGWLAAEIATVLGLVGFGLTVATAGRTLLSADKTDLIGILNRWYMVWTMGASVGAVLSFNRARWKLFFICVLLLLANVYVGARSSFAMTLIAIFTLWLMKKGRQRLIIQNWWIGVLGLCGALFLFVYKYLYHLVKLGRWDLIAERALSPQFHLLTIARSEPFFTQSILNEIIRQNFKIGMEHFANLASLLIVGSPELGTKTPGFDELFQHTLFPRVPWTMAGHIWAEMWSSGGWPLLLLFIGIFTLLLCIGSYLLRLSDPTLQSGLALLGSYWSFYIHRNEILYQINLERNVLLVWVACVLVSIVLTGAGQRRVPRSRRLPRLRRGLIEH